MRANQILSSFFEYARLKLLTDDFFKIFNDLKIYGDSLVNSLFSRITGCLVTDFNVGNVVDLRMQIAYIMIVIL